MHQAPSNQPHPRVLVFDSGVGGLTIAEPVMRANPHFAITYCADNRFFPYGTKAEDTIRERVCQIMAALTERYPCDLVIIACNTASTIALDAVRHQSKVPVVGVVPAVKPAAEKSITRAIGVLATAAAVQTAYTQRLIDEFAQGCRVVLRGSALLVEMAEQKLRGFSVDIRALEAELKPFLHQAAGQSPIDSIVLGCTHFPLLIDEMRQVCGGRLSFVDSGEAIARRVGNLLPNVSNEFSSQPFHLALFTESTAALPPLVNALHVRGFKRIEILDI